MMDTKDMDAVHTSQGPSRREVLIKGAKLLPYVVPVVSTILVQGVRTAEAHHRPGHRSCPPGQVQLSNGKCKSPPSKHKSSSDNKL